MKKQSKKQIEARIKKAYYASCNRIQIPMMMVPKVWRVGEELVAAGADDAALEAGLRKFVDQIAIPQ
jgi:hypothetical protein